MTAVPTLVFPILIAISAVLTFTSSIDHDDTPDVSTVIDMEPETTSVNGTQ